MAGVKEGAHGGTMGSPVLLDEAIGLWQRGEELYAFCRGKLDAAEGEIEELAKRAEAAAPVADSDGNPQP